MKTLLVIEDDADIQDYYGILLADLGVKLIRAYNGKEGLDVIDSGESVDLVLLDIVLPEMGGTEFFRRLRLDRKSGVPVIGCSVDEKLVEPLRGFGSLQGTFLKGDSGSVLIGMIKEVLA